MALLPPLKGPLGGWERIQTRDGKRSIRLDARGKLAVIVESEGASGEPLELDRAELAYPGSGYGGHELLLSARERYLALFLYSGQSECGYEVFELAPSLRHVCGLPYVAGEGLGPTFSPDERRIALAYAVDPGLVLEECDLDDDGRTTEPCRALWAHVRVRDLSTHDAATCSILVNVPRGVPFEGSAQYYPQKLGFAENQDIVFETPWGLRARVPISMPESIVVEGPFTEGCDRG